MRAAIVWTVDKRPSDAERDTLCAAFSACLSRSPVSRQNWNDFVVLVLILFVTCALHSLLITSLCGPLLQFFFLALFSLKPSDLNVSVEQVNSLVPSAMFRLHRSNGGPVGKRYRAKKFRLICSRVCNHVGLYLNGVDIWKVIFSTNYPSRIWRLFLRLVRNPWDNADSGITRIRRNQRTQNKYRQYSELVTEHRFWWRFRATSVAIWFENTDFVLETKS